MVCKSSTNREKGYTGQLDDAVYMRGGRCQAPGYGEGGAIDKTRTIYSAIWAARLSV